ncbi:Mov34/MPN/PAD-1 family protein [Thozetella sp. PMI_491]|nr:Mov34/MPN/PAD-1 family protein [Thozetella sp. PMI_491]
MSIIVDSGEVLDQRVMSRSELNEKAEEFAWNPNIGFKYWVRAADAIFKEAKIHIRDGNWANAYLFLLRYSHLLVDKLAKHPRAKDPESKKAFRPLMGRMPEVLGELERLKPVIDDNYQEWVRINAAQRDASTESPRSGYAKHASQDPALSWNPTAPTKILDAGEHRDLAVDLAQREIRRRRREAGIPEEEEQRRRTGGVWDSWDTTTGNSGYNDDQELRAQMAATRRTLDRSADSRGDDNRGSFNDPLHDALRQRPSSQRTHTAGFSATHYNYPSINRSAPLQYESRTSRLRHEPIAPQPPRPPKEFLRERSPSPSRYSIRPPVPDKEPVYAPLSVPSSGDVTPPALPPKTATSPEQKRVTFRPAAYLENGTPLRTMFLPTDLRQSFLKAAYDNTRRGLEMCGILCGTVVNNALFVSCLLIPEQTCTSDTCETENESAVLDYCINEDLLILGWIHTHPTQTCFMSSRDLHTQASYQVMMPESIAIVCAPKFEPSYGIFRLTNPPGLPHILQCDHSDTFHQHSIDNIYTDAENPPGHVYETSKMSFTVHDLRPKK